MLPVIDITIQYTYCFFKYNLKMFIIILNYSMIASQNYNFPRYMNRTPEVKINHTQRI